ncbi:trigger factor [Geofilum rubicundum]|uniref:Cell division trigger factor n=1 Tax=Geofilum rubicundum JCM 15548 TaxID=1236989 RepID=A0A0E9LUL5_9BACT|nr:trigger factor [Geofilum rubicundum]GAO28978.1 cell division trigger factor [Geofilum rubicundum JCM 15548]
MNITRENIDELNAVIKLTIDKDDYEQKVADVLKTYQKKANMPGFRPGKVPAGLIKKMYGNAVMVDEINKLVSENLSNYLTENELNILGEPLPSEAQQPIDFDTQDSFEFAFDIALSPTVEVKLSKREKLPYYQIEVSDDMLDGQIKNLTGRFGTNDVVEAVTEQSLAKGDFVQVDKDGNPVEDGIVAEDAVMSMAIVKNDAQKKKLLGKKVGEEVVFDVKKAFPNDTEISYLLKITKEQAAEVKGDFKFTIKEITEFIEPELNKELFDKLFGPGVVSTEEEMKTKVKEDLQRNFEMESEYKFAMDAREKLTSKLDVQLPEEFLKRWLKATDRGEEKMSDEQIDNDMPKFMEDLKWQLIKNEIIRSNELKVEEKDVVDYAKKSARMQFMQYGLTNLPDEHIEGYAMDMLKKEDQGRRMAEAAIQEKVMAFIKEAVKIDEQNISREDFNKLFDNN